MRKNLQKLRTRLIFPPMTVSEFEGIIRTMPLTKAIEKFPSVSEEIVTAAALNLGYTKAGVKYAYKPVAERASRYVPVLSR